MRFYASIAYGLVRFAFGLKPFLRDPLSREAAERIVRRGMQTRNAAFLCLVERAVFGKPSSPYLKLLRAAGCELGDVRRLVSQEGVEGALQTLLEAGVYASYEELKGRAPAVRGSQKFVFRDTDFDNPLITPHYYSRSGGSRGKPTRIMIDLDHLAQMAPHWSLGFAAHGLWSSPLVFFTPYYPAMVNHQLMCAKFGNRFVKWFCTGGGGTPMYRLVSAYVHALARRAAGFPKPEPVPLTQAQRVGEYLIELTANELRPCISTSPSAAVRVCVAMERRGASLEGATFLLGYEPLTPTRRRTIEATGARVAPTYGFSEGGHVGSQCSHPGPADDVHVCLDAYAVMTRPQPPGENGGGMDALLITALRPACPKILLNAEVGDCARIETRRCGCLFDDLGYYQHIHTIRSFEKLTGEGVTFIGADLYQLLEEVLPRRFGGTLADYQLVELQDDRGLPRYNLLVSPEIGAVDENALVTTFLRELGRLRRPYRFMANQWAQADLIRVERQRPIATARGKIMPFRTLGRATNGSHT